MAIFLSISANTPSCPLKTTSETGLPARASESSRVMIAAPEKCTLAAFAPG